MATESNILGSIIEARQQGNNPSMGGNITDRALHNEFVENFYGGKLYVDGFMCTSRVSENMTVSSIRVPLIAPPPFAPRTISINGANGEASLGTVGNSGSANANPFYTPQTEGVEISFTQVYDQGIKLYKILQNMVSLDHLGSIGKQIPKAVAMMEDASILAVQLNAALAYAGKYANKNIVEFDPAKRAEVGYVTDKMTEALGKLYDPDVPYNKGVVSYAQDDLGILMTNDFKRYLMTKGAFIINSEKGQEMVIKGVTNTGEVIGGGTLLTPIDGVKAKILPKQYLKFAAQYLHDKTAGTSLNANAFDKVLCVIASSDSTGIGRIDTYVGFEKALDSGTPGTIIQNLWQWGAEVVREFAIAVIVEKGFVNPNAAGTAKLIVAPAEFNNVAIVPPNEGTAAVGDGFSTRTAKTGVKGAGGTYNGDDATTGKDATTATTGEDAGK